MPESTSYRFDVTLQCQATQTVSQLPKAAQILQALPPSFAGSHCSDLLPAGFSYKPMNITLGLDGDDNEGYTIIKRLKSASYISDRARLQNTAAIVMKLRNGAMLIQDGYIGAEDLAEQAIRKVLLPEQDTLFGLELQAGSTFRFFLKTTQTQLPQTLLLEGVRFRVAAYKPVYFQPGKQYVLQCDLPLAPSWRIMPNSQSCFKLAYNCATKQKYLCAGSVIDRTDFFGSTVDI